MTLGEIRARVRRKLLEETEGFWSDEELNQEINDGYLDLAVDAKLLADPFTLTTASGQELYDLPDNLIAVRAVTFEGRDLPRMPYAERSQDEGPPRFYQVIGQKLRLFPTPDGTYTVTVLYYYRPERMANDFDVPEIPEEYHRLLVDYAVARALLKDENPAYAAYEQSYLTGKDQMILALAARDQASPQTVFDPYGMWW